MAVTIAEVEAHSIARRSRIAPGHRLLRINGHDIDDVLDYRFYMSESALELELETETGQRYTKAIHKRQYADLGLVFGSYLMDKQRSCHNKCLFCFIDQLPTGMRESLYFKDDDSRLSFLFGNYITLTNLKDRDIDRIVDMRISPVNISVHTTDPELRVRMMGNPRAGEVLGYIPKLIRAGIQVNAQLVLCPGVNDGPALGRSLEDLAALVPALQSAAVVPVGLTRFRDSLSPLRLFTKEEARAVLDLVRQAGGRMRRQTGRRVFYAADEWYLTAQQPIPPATHYEDFPQLENGVGMLALLQDDFRRALEDTPARPLDRRVTIATGALAHPFIRAIAQAACEKFPGLSARAIAIRNDFFGESITVAGLVTGADLTRQLTGAELGDEVLIPASMLRREGDLFLDSVSLQDVEQALGRPVKPIPNSGEDLLAALLK